MDVEETVNITYITDVIDFMKQLLMSKEKKHSFTQGNLASQWNKLLSVENKTYLNQIKTCHDVDDLEYFNLLLAMSLEMSGEVQERFVKLYNVLYATPFLALQLYQELHSTCVQDNLVAIQDQDWSLFYNSHLKKGEYLHDRALLLQPWILSYCCYGGVMRCRYVSFAFARQEQNLSYEEGISFQEYAKQGMKGILSYDDEIQLLQTLNGQHITACTIDLAHVPLLWNAHKLFSLCAFYAKVIQCAFLIRLQNEAQKKFLKPIIESFPFTFLITSQELLPANIPILRMPYSTDSSHATNKNSFIKEYHLHHNLPQFIGEATFMNRLDEFILMAKHKDEIHQLISFDTATKGISALFYGPSGNGKTLSARYIAKKLKKRLWQIELSNVLDKYIGESEKHLEAIFHDAEKEKVILLFDEADTLFAKRTTVQDANDRYANAITSYLIQRMESFSGIMILTSNFLHNFDDAFLRRIHCILRFYEANKEQRLHKWQLITKHIEVADTIDWDEIANIKLSYARIDQCLFTACSFMVSQQQTCLLEQHIKKAIVYELEKHRELPPKGWWKES